MGMTKKWIIKTGLFGLVSLVALAKGKTSGAQTNTNSGVDDWQLGFVEPVTPVMEDLVFMHDKLLMPIITVITLLVLGLLLYVMWRFSEKRNPEPSKTTHNTLLEIIWTTVPVLILVIIAIPSFQLLYKADVTPTGAGDIPAPEMTLKIIGRQWYWSYEYPDHDDITFDSIMIPESELKPGQLRLLEVDERMIVPVNTTVRLLITSSDVLHNWAMPAFGIKTDTVPGRINETWFHVTKTGVYRGQCSELCGIGHAYMPIVVEVVPKPVFEAWVGQMQAKMPSEKDPTDMIALAKAAKQAWEARFEGE